MTSVFYILRRITIPAIIISISYLIPCNLHVKESIAAAQPSSKPEINNGSIFSQQVEHFLNSLEKVPADKCTAAFGKYSKVIEDRININKIYTASYKEVETLLNSAVNESIDALTLFTQPLLHEQSNGTAIVFNEELLTLINKNFNFHGLFNISTPSLDGDSDVKMKFLVVGQKKFIVGYNRRAVIKHPDYSFATGKYEYQELFIMDVNKDSNGNLGFFNIKGMSNPDDTTQWMKGPLNVDIHYFIMTSSPEGGRKIKIEYSMLGKKHKFIDPIPIDRL